MGLERRVAEEEGRKVAEERRVAEERHLVREERGAGDGGEARTFAAVWAA